MGISSPFSHRDQMPTPGNKAWQILVVDDEPTVCDTIKMLFRLDGHKVQTANSSKEALSLLEKGEFDLITTDYAMEGMKGDELAAIIKKRLPHLPIIMVTAHVEMLKSSNNPLPGVDCIIGKPFSLEELRGAVAQLLPGS